MLDVLVVDDEADIRDLVSEILKDEGFNPKVAANSDQAFKIIAEKPPAIIILDIWLQGSNLDGLSILEIVKKRYPTLPIVVISGHGTVETAVSAIKLGAYDYLEKPFSQNKLMITLKRAYEAAKLKRENFDLRSKVIDKTELVGVSAITNKLRIDIEKVAASSSRVMIQGEVGTGKELAARLIHKKSKRALAPFIVFSPTCTQEDKVLQELFGEHEECNGTNSTFIKRRNVLESADKGTLYIDEIVDLPNIVQAKLLKFLQDQIMEKTSSNKSVKLDVRFITSTSKNLQEEVDNDHLRQDLYHRLSVVTLKVPSLSERKEDIPLLVKYFVKQLSKFSGIKEREFSDEVISKFQSYDWSGNIRQLRNVIEWVLIMNPIHSKNDEIIKSHMLPPDILKNSVNLVMPDSNNLDMMAMPLREAREIFEKQYLVAQMNRFNNNISKTSFFVGMERSALHRKLKLLSIQSINNRLHEEECYE